MQQPSLQDFLGAWQLRPERSVYSVGDPPQRATYQISGDQHALVFTIAWVDQSGKSFQVGYQCVPDGLRHDYADLPTVDQMQTQLVDNNLQTISYKNNVVVALADRKLSANGHELEVLQRYLRPDHTELSILQFYSRREETLKSR